MRINTRKNTTSRLTIAALALISAGATQAATINISTAFGNGADAHTSEHTPDTANNGTDAFVRFSNPSGTSNDRMDQYALRFDLSGVMAITTASLEVTQWRDLSSGDSINVWGVVDGQVGDALADWSESALTYNNAPWLFQDSGIDNEDPGNGMLNNNGNTTIPVLLGSFTANTSLAGGTHTFSSAAMLAFLQADTNGLATIYLSQDSGTAGGVLDRYATKETTDLSDSGGSGVAGTYAPQLVLEATAVPEPSSTALLGLGGLALILRRRT